MKKYFNKSDLFRLKKEKENGKRIELMRHTSMGRIECGVYNDTEIYWIAVTTSADKDHNMCILNVV